MSNEAEIVRQVDSNTGLETEVQSCTHILVATEINTTVNENVNQLAVDESVTNVGADLEEFLSAVVKQHVSHQIALTLLITESNTHCPSVVDVVTNLGNNLELSLCISIAELNASYTNATTEVNLCTHCYCYESSCHCH